MKAGSIKWPKRLENIFAVTENSRELSKAFNIYPNPINQNFVLELNNTIQGKIKVAVLKMTEKVEKTFYVNKTTETSKHHLSL